jgi:hypothetical protein
MQRTKATIAVLLLGMLSTASFQNCTPSFSAPSVSGAVAVRGAGSVHLPAIGYAAFSGASSARNQNAALVAMSSAAKYGMENLSTESIVPSSTYALYSPWRDGSNLYVGGWLNETDFNYKSPYASTGACSLPGGCPGPDRIYVSKLENGVFGEPQGLHFVGPGAGDVPGEVKGYHANDMSIIHPTNAGGQDRHDWLYMFFTCLPNEYFQYPNSTNFNRTCWASSTDGGATWYVPAQPELIGQNNGHDNLGAWAPTAIISPDQKEIWVYFNTNGPTAHVFRTRLPMAGWPIIATEEVLLPGHQQIAMSNVDVSYVGGVFYLAGNHLGDSGNNRFFLYVSADGLNWLPFDGAAGCLVDAGSNTVLTPHFHLLSASGGIPKFEMYFGFNPGNGTFLERWSFDLHTVAPSGPAPVPTLVPTPVPTPVVVDHSREIAAAGQAFVDAFASLQIAHQNNATGAQLQPFIDVCVAAQNNARNWGIAVDQWVCR